MRSKAIPGAWRPHAIGFTMTPVGLSDRLGHVVEARNDRGDPSEGGPPPGLGRGRRLPEHGGLRLMTDAMPHGRGRPEAVVAITRMASVSSVARVTVMAPHTGNKTPSDPRAR